jgi:murein DD-endopeptidase MepM/ murein hydrolase activator NlpD
MTNMNKRVVNQILALTAIFFLFLNILPLRAQEIKGLADGVYSREELEKLIRAKSEELENINRQIEETEKNLEETVSERVSLQKELNRLQYNINQLQLSIQADQITAQKLALEIDSLNYDVNDIELAIRNKRTTIAYLLRELQRYDNTDFLYIFLKNNSLADGVLESQSLRNLREQLAVDIDNLANLQRELKGKIMAISDRKAEIEFRKSSSEIRKALVEDEKNARAVILAQTKNKESLYEQQLQELRKQQDDIADTIAKIEDKLRAEFNFDLLPTKRPGVLAWPLPPENKKITQHFGEISYLYRGKPHNGLDISVPIGTPVLAADDGVVLAVDNNDKNSWRKYQYGKYVLIQHNNGLTTLYAHLSREIVKKGESVARGQIIGYSGNTGYSTGPHLHLGLYWAPRGICPSLASNPVDCVQLKSIPPAAGLVPVGVVIAPEDYL